ncbi:MAG: nascent polypeptide-associated complex protein [Candidatus Micrarchaeota archaeon]
MLPGMNPKQMAQMMKQMGIDVKEIDAESVLIKKKDGNTIVIENPSVQEIGMKGQKSFQISGEITEANTQKEESDADLVMKECGVSREEAEKALSEANGDLAEAIMALKNE